MIICGEVLLWLVFPSLTSPHPSSQQGDRTTIHKNLCVCLLIAETVFLAGVNQTDKPVVCGVVAGLLHFFFLAAFVWMFMEGRERGRRKEKYVQN